MSLPLHTLFAGKPTSEEARALVLELSYDRQRLDKEDTRYVRNLIENLYQEIDTLRAELRSYRGY